MLNAVGDQWRDPSSARACLDAIRCVLKTGCQWSLLSKEFAPKSTVHDALTRWTAQGLWPRINESLRTKTRLMLKNAMPSAAIIDSQSVKGGQKDQRTQTPRAHRPQRPAAGRGGPCQPMCRIVTARSCCCACSATVFMSLLSIFADGDCVGKLEAFVQDMGRLFGHAASFVLSIVKKLEEQKGFVVLPRRWVMERSFG